MSLLRLIRLTRRKDFLFLAKEGRKAVASGLVLQVAPSSDEALRIDTVNIARVGFTVSSKVGNAVVRNRVRRRLKAAVTEVFPQSAQAGLDYVVIGRRAALKRPYGSLIKDLKYALHNTGTFHVEHTDVKH